MQNLNEAEKNDYMGRKVYVKYYLITYKHYPTDINKMRLDRGIDSLFNFEKSHGLPITEVSIDSDPSIFD